MRYYIKDWFSKLKHSDLFTVVINDSDENNKQNLGCNDLNLETSNSSISSDHNSTINSDVHFTSKVTSKKNETNTYYQSLYAFVVYSCYILCFLANFFNREHKFSGLLFLLNIIVVLTFLIFYYPTYTLSIPGHVVLRILKWIYIFLVISIFLFLLRNHTNVCSSFLVCISVGTKLFREIPCSFPKTFSYCELVLISSIFTNALFTFFMHFSNTIPTKYEESIIIEQAACWLCVVIFLATNFKIFRESIVGFATAGVFVLAFQFTPLCIFILEKNPFIWLFNYLFNTSYQRIFLFIYWVGIFNCLTIVLAIQKFLTEKISSIEQKKNEENLLKSSADPYLNSNVTFDVDPVLNEKLIKQQKIEQNLIDNKHTLLTSMRKIFHFLICLVYFLGLFYDRHLLLLCSYGMLILLALIETIRYFKIGRLSEYINQIMSTFIDEKDSESQLILSHIYLLVGLSYPLWISNFDILSLSQLSGLITVGVGDSFASLIGSRFGKHKLPGCSKKSIEGTLALMLSEFLILIILADQNFFDISNEINIYLIIVFMVLTGFVEAYTNDNDNLILPIVAYPFLASLSQ